MLIDDIYMEDDKKFFGDNPDKRYYIRDKMGDEKEMFKESVAVLVIHQEPGIRSRHGVTQRFIPESIQEALYAAFNIAYKEMLITGGFNGYTTEDKEADDFNIN